MGLVFPPGWPRPQSFYFKLPTIAGDGVSQNFFVPGIVILLISASQVARIIGMSHWHLAQGIIYLFIYFYFISHVCIQGIL
jgi:hypothetical protein